MKNKKALMIYAPVAGLVVLFCLYMIFSGKVSLSMNGFAVDKDECLYIGKEYTIEVYKNDELLRTINPQTSRAYIFTILNGDTILLSTSTKVYTMDLYGNVLSEKEDDMTKVYNDLQKAKKEFVAVNGEKYHLQNTFGRTYIIKDSNVIYEMPLLDYIVLIMLVLTFISLWSFVFIMVLSKKQSLNDSVIDG